MTLAAAGSVTLEVRSSPTATRTGNIKQHSKQTSSVRMTRTVTSTGGKRLDAEVGGQRMAVCFSRHGKASFGTATGVGRYMNLKESRKFEGGSVGMDKLAHNDWSWRAEHLRY